MRCASCSFEFPTTTTFPFWDHRDGSICHVCRECNDNAELWEYDDLNLRALRSLDTPRVEAVDGESTNDDRPYFSIFNGDSLDCRAIYKCGACENTCFGPHVRIEDRSWPVCHKCAHGCYYFSTVLGQYFAGTRTMSLREAIYRDERAELAEAAPAAPAPVEAAPSAYDWGSRSIQRPPSQVTTESPSGYTATKGRASARFLDYPYVGIEFEHAPVQNKAQACNSGSLFRWIASGLQSPEKSWDHFFMCHSDGSIDGRIDHSSSEIVSTPTSGDLLDAVINRFYEPFATKTFTPGPENRKCGFHMHVESRYLMWMKRGNEDRDINSRAIATEALRLIFTICKEFISSSRRDNRFCHSKPAVRSKSTSLTGSTAMINVFGHNDYPGVAVRTMGTIEYRMWPSSNSIRNTRARAELSQKLTAHFDSCVMNADVLAPEPHREHLEGLRAVAELCVGGARLGVPDALGELLSLSETTVRDLKSILERYNPFSHGATHFQFSKEQLSHLRSESTMNSTAIKIPGAMPIVEIGDTTAQSDLTDPWLTFGECIKCYPAAVEGAMPDLVANLATGGD